MMLFDASAIVNICSRGELEKLEGYTSSLAIFEIGNAIWKQVYQRKRLNEDEGMKVLNVMKEVLESLEKLEIDEPQDVLKIAVENGITFYDSAYLYLAIKNDLSLVTDDEKLYRIAGKYVRVLRSRDL